MHSPRPDETELQIDHTGLLRAPAGIEASTGASGGVRLQVSADLDDDLVASTPTRRRAFESRVEGSKSTIHSLLRTSRRELKRMVALCKSYTERPSDDVAEEFADRATLARKPLVMAWRMRRAIGNAEMKGVLAAVLATSRLDAWEKLVAKPDAVEALYHVVLNNLAFHATIDDRVDAAARLDELDLDFAGLHATEEQPDASAGESD